MTSQLWLAVGPLSLYGGLLTISKMCSFHNKALAVSWKVLYP